MKVYKGFVKVNTDSYDSFRRETIGNAYDVDGEFGYQCYDYGNLFWKNYTGRWVVSKTKDGGYKGCASGIWGARIENNKGNEFEFITDYKKLKRGDIVITNNNKAGHICFMDENYSSSKKLKVLGQNQGGSNGKLPEAKVKILNWAFKDYFLGAFRVRKWNNEIYKKGIYKCLYNMYIRKTPDGSPVKVKECTTEMKKALTSKNPNADAIIKKGTNITALKIIYENGNYYLQNYNGYVAIEKDGIKYCKYVK